MQGLFTESYEPLGDLILKYNLNGEPTDYYRDLDISTAVATTRFKVNGVEYKRELFVCTTAGYDHTSDGQSERRFKF